MDMLSPLSAADMNNSPKSCMSIMSTLSTAARYSWSILAALTPLRPLLDCVPFPDCVAFVNSVLEVSVLVELVCEWLVLSLVLSTSDTLLA